MPSHRRPRRRGVRAPRKAAGHAKRTAAGLGSGSPRAIWAYAYQIVPPQTRSRLRAVGAILDQEHATAQHGSRTWAGRLIVGAQVTRILIVSDNLELSHEANQRLEAELRLLKVVFSATEPVKLPGYSIGGVRRR
jgi:hypothetical protein